MSHRRIAEDESSIISKGKGDAKFQIVFTGAELEEAKIKVYRSKDQFQIDGFRKGKGTEEHKLEKNMVNLYIAERCNGIY